MLLKHYSLFSLADPIFCDWTFSFIADKQHVYLFLENSTWIKSMKTPTAQAHTFASHTKPTHKPKLAKECAFCHLKKIELKIPYPSKRNKFLPKLFNIMQKHYKTMLLDKKIG